MTTERRPGQRVDDPRTPSESMLDRFAQAPFSKMVIYLSRRFGTPSAADPNIEFRGGGGWGRGTPGRATFIYPAPVAQPCAFWSCEKALDALIMHVM